MSYYVCTELTATGDACVTWAPYVGGIPLLTVEDGLLLASSIAAIWAVGFALGEIRRFILNR